MALVDVSKDRLRIQTFFNTYFFTVLVSRAIARGFTDVSMDIKSIIFYPVFCVNAVSERSRVRKGTARHGNYSA